MSLGYICRAETVGYEANKLILIDYDYADCAGCKKKIEWLKRLISYSCNAGYCYVNEYVLPDLVNLLVP